LESLRRHIEVALSQRQHTPIRPARGLPWNELRHLRQLRVRVDVIANLQRRQAYVKSRHHLVVHLRRTNGELSRSTSGKHDRHAANHSERNQIMQWRTDLA